MDLSIIVCDVDGCSLLFSQIFGMDVGVSQMVKVIIIIIFYLCGGSIFGGGVDDNGLIDGGADGRVEVVHIYLFYGVGNDGGGSKQM